VTLSPVPLRPPASGPAGLPAVRSDAVGGWLVDQLPACFAGDDFLRRFVGIFQEVADGLRRRIDGIEHTVDATVAPPPFVRWMGGWLGVEGIDPSVPLGRQRELVFGFGRLLSRRGTGGGLREALQLVTGEEAVVRDPGGILRDGDDPPEPAPVRIELRGTGPASEPDVVAVIADWIPAAASAELWIGGRRVWVRDEGGRR
jgi:phage tail-like protein